MAKNNFTHRDNSLNHLVKYYVIAFELNDYQAILISDLLINIILHIYIK